VTAPPARRRETFAERRALHQRAKIGVNVHNGYAKSNVGNQRLWPADPDAAERMLDFFLIEKGFYEIEYELAHRPDWLRVPLTGMLRILSQQPVEAL